MQNSTNFLINNWLNAQLIIDICNIYNIYVYIYMYIYIYIRHSCEKTKATFLNNISTYCILQFY